MEDTKILLSEKDIPQRWYNIQPDLPKPVPPPLNPATKQPIGPQDRVVVALVVALVADLQENVAISLVEQPVCGVRDSVFQRIFILEALVLPKVEATDDGHHAELVSSIENLR